MQCITIIFIEAKKNADFENRVQVRAKRLFVVKRERQGTVNREPNSRKVNLKMYTSLSRNHDELSLGTGLIYYDFCLL